MTTQSPNHLVTLSSARAHIYAAIDGERAYQDTKYGPAPERDLTLGEYLHIAQDELTEAQTAHDFDDPNEALLELLQVVAVGVAAIEQHGLITRNTQHATRSTPCPNPTEAPTQPAASVATAPAPSATSFSVAPATSQPAPTSAPNAAQIYAHQAEIIRELQRIINLRSCLITLAVTDADLRTAKQEAELMQRDVDNISALIVDLETVQRQGGL